ncbi:MAG: serine/threonine-protein kinase [Gemmatimonadaceae bacterium]
MNQLQDLSAALADRYENLTEVGRGGFATVYSALDRRHGSRVAIKVLRPELAPALGAMRFTREVQITAQLQHPHILPLLDSGEANGVPYYVMPFVEGESLGSRLSREGPLPIDDAVRLVREVADGLAYAHAQGFIHRDIKPDNILLSQGHAVIADFGVARAVDVTGAERLTDSGLALGTVMYMSPEQASGERVDGRSDIYALACVLYEVLTGSPPFSGASAQQVMARHAVDPPPSIRSVRATVSPALEAVIMRALTKAPADRYATASEFGEALGRALTAPQLTVPPRPRGWRLPAIAVVLVLAAALAITLWQRTSARVPALDPNRVLVYPLVLPPEWSGSRATGEDVATIIGSAVDGAGPLRWIDGWQLLDARYRDNIRSLPADEAAALARRQRAAYMLTGRIVMRGGAGDTADVFLELRDVANDDVIARPSASAPKADVWRAGLAATTPLLPLLIHTGIPDVASEWQTRSPTAVAHFLVAESAFRRVQLDSAEHQFALAVQADSSFGLAAIRGAQAASWNHHYAGAASLIAAARRSALRPRHAAFAAGYQQFLDGRADSAVFYFGRALASDSSSAFVWMQLGEVYAHLLPVEGNADSLEDAVLTRAYALDSTATNVLFHLVEVRLRHGDADGAAPLVRRFLATRPDTSLARQIEHMNNCVRDGPQSIRWDSVARAVPEPLLQASAALSAGGRQWACAAAGFEATLIADTAGTAEADARRWYALVGLHGLELSRGDTAAAAKAIGAFIDRWGNGTSLYLFDAVALNAFNGQADSVAARDASQYGTRFERCPSYLRCWLLGLYLTKRGRSGEAAVIAQRLLAPPGRAATGTDSLLTQSVRAHIALTSGDTASAIAQLRQLLERGRPMAGVDWDLALPTAIERLELARLLAALGQSAAAVAVSDVFDSRALIHSAFLARSLDLRARASEALSGASATAYRARLRAMQQHAAQ